MSTNPPAGHLSGGRPAAPPVVGLAAAAVTCPTCKARPGNGCESTGGGNFAYVPTHQARINRLAHWSQQQADEAETAVKQARQLRNRQQNVPAGFFDRFESSAAPIPPAKPKPVSPTAVRLTENQAEQIEGYVLSGGYGSCPTAHLHGMAGARQTANALEAKGIIEQHGEGDGYERPMRLTEFGWAVYDQHPKIIKRLTDEQVAEQRARAESGRCLNCGQEPGTRQDCDDCGLVRHIAALDTISAFNQQHPHGVRVRYWPDGRDRVGLVSVTTSGAFVARNNEVPSIRVEGAPRDLLLSEVDVLGEVTDLAAAPELGPKRDGHGWRDVILDGRVIGNVAPMGDGYDGETEHGVCLYAGGGVPFASAELAAAAVADAWRAAEAGPDDEDGDGTLG